jgi:hypothetical protein
MNPTNSFPLYTGGLSDRADAIVESFANTTAMTMMGLGGTLFVLALGGAWIAHRYLRATAANR